MQMTYGEAYAAIKVALRQIKSLSHLINQDDITDPKVLELYTLCKKSLIPMGQCAECIITNSNLAKERILNKK